MNKPLAVFFGAVGIAILGILIYAAYEIQQNVEIEVSYTKSRLCVLDDKPAGSSTETQRIKRRLARTVTDKTVREGYCPEHLAEEVELVTTTVSVCPKCDDERKTISSKKSRVKRADLPARANARGSGSYAMEEVKRDDAACRTSICKCMVKRKWERETCELVSRGKVRIGMTAEQVRAAWGAPNDINRTRSATYSREQWVYDSQYLYFDNGTLTTIQD